MSGKELEALLAIQAGCTLYMVGLIWVMQGVHYPLFDSVGEESFRKYERRHTVRMNPLLLPALAEVIAAAWLVSYAPTEIPGWALWTSLGLVLLVWASTAFLQAPYHGRLLRGFDAAVHRKLVATNWIRTAGWTLRGPLVLWMWWQLP